MKPWRRWQDWLNLFLGVWVFAAPWLLGYSGAAESAWNAWIVGTFIALVGLWALAVPRNRSIESLNMVSGGYLAYSGIGTDSAIPAAMANDLASGLAVLVLAIWANRAAAAAAARAVPARQKAE